MLTTTIIPSVCAAVIAHLFCRQNTLYILLNVKNRLLFIRLYVNRRFHLFFFQSARHSLDLLSFSLFPVVLISNYGLSQVDFKFLLRLRHLSGRNVSFLLLFYSVYFALASFSTPSSFIFFLFMFQFLSLGCILHTELDAYARSHIPFFIVPHSACDDIRSTAWFANFRKNALA